MGGPQVKKHLLSAHFFKPVLQLGKLLKNFCSVLRIKKKKFIKMSVLTLKEKIWEKLNFRLIFVDGVY